MSFGNKDAWNRYMVGAYAPEGPIFVSGKGSTLLDRAGNDFIDFSAGVAVSSLGHGEANLTRAIAEQSRLLMHVSNLYVHNRTVKTARRLLKLTGMKKAFFSSSGAEANECALKIARKRGTAIAKGKHRVVSLKGSFHGRIGLSLAASGQPKLWKEFGPLAPGFTHVSMDDEKEIKAAFSNKVCAAIVEPIQGESGVVQVPTSTLKLLNKLCLKNDALFIVDEIQCGMGRTGNLLAHKGTGITPDVITLGKGLGGGFPVAATLLSGRADGVLQPGDHGTTYGGNPVAMAVIEEILMQIPRSDFIARVRSRGAYLQRLLKALKRRGLPIADIRGKGLMVGLVIDTDRAKPRRLAYRALEEGVLVIPTGDDVIRIVPPLNITRAEIKRGVSRLRRAFGNL